MPNEGNTIEEIEIALLLRGLEARYGYDLQSYQRHFVRQHVKSEAEHHGLHSVSSLQEKLLRDGELFQHFLKRFSDTEGHPFQHAGFLKALKETVFPYLKTYPSVRVWGLGGDVSGLYSLAILLEEAGLLERSTLYFTNVSELVLEKGYGVHGIKRRSSVFNTDRIDHLYQTPHVDPSLSMPIHASSGKKNWERLNGV